MSMKVRISAIRYNSNTFPAVSPAADTTAQQSFSVELQPIIEDGSNFVNGMTIQMTVLDTSAYIIGQLYQLDFTKL